MTLPTPLPATFVTYGKGWPAREVLAAAVEATHPTRQAAVLTTRARCPRWRARWPRAVVFPLEDLGRRELFLDLHASVGPETVLVMDGTARYTQLPSDKFTALHRLRKLVAHRYGIDDYPFCKAVHKLYLPWSYVDRDVLGYSNGWSFEYDYLEEDSRGRTRRAHDPEFLAEKLAPHCRLLFERFFSPVAYVETRLSAEEGTAYQARKRELFDRFSNPRRIVTYLADFANTVASRHEGVAAAVAELPADARIVAYTNLASNNAPLRRFLKQRLGRRVDVRSFMAHDGEPVPADHVVVVETPINQNRVAALDVVSDLPDHCRMTYVTSDARVDDFVRSEVRLEWDGIAALVAALWRQQCAST